ncbi:MAG: hypothetical protein M1834_004925 [Cirrosporium novae-zelandiae]|nr:MAG: hypothetical protein M1834_004925 [Cirrosporium novae-zelandiae]
MATLKVATKANQATILPVILITSYLNETAGKAEVVISFEDVDKFKESGATVEFDNGSSIHGEVAVTQKLLELFPSLRGKDSNLEDEWVARLPQYHPLDFKAVEGPLLELDSHLTLRSHLVGYSLSVAELAIWGAIRGNRVGFASAKRGHIVNLARWFNYIEETNPWIASAVESMLAHAKAKRAAKSKEGASYDIDLMNTDKGVITRFPPEPSGYLHIGHAKAALLNDYFAHEKYKGTLICRFDDTNPTKEKMEFQDAIIEDLALMGIKPDKQTFSSDYFDEMYNYCLQIIKEGKAYADDTEQETMRAERMDGIASKNRDAAVEENLARFDEMKTGSDEGKRWCIRAKISIDDTNKAMRDPVIYRCNPQPHHRTGEKWKIYPTYDFCAPIVDSIEGVTHALRTNEYRDRNAQYDWMQEALHLRPVQIWDFARMNFIRTLLSKRKLTKFVDSGIVWGWDDPRFPTVRGIRRRGMTIPALREFILKQGPSRNIVNLDWTLFWATNKKYIDPVAPRHITVFKENVVKAVVKGTRDAPYTEDKPLHPKNPSVGTKKVVYSSHILLDQEDAQSFAQDEEVTLMNWGNAFVRKISHSLNPLSKTVTGLEFELHLQGDVKKTAKKLTWLSEEGQELVPVELVDFDYLITKEKLEENDNYEDFLTPQTEFRTEGFADCNVANLKENDIIQFERKGYYRVDRPFLHGKPAVLFNIPTGKSK